MDLEEGISTLFETLSDLRKTGGAVHPRFGDLAQSDAVVMSALSRPSGLSLPLDDVIVHLTVTGRCNARCQGCINTSLEEGRHARSQVVAEFECDPQRDSATIVRLAQRCGDRPVTVALYGGEPLLEVDRILRLMEALKTSPIGARVRYMLYTNGQLLSEVVRSRPELFASVALLSVSVDGEAAQHRSFRPGTDLETIEAGLSSLRGGFKGEVLCWSTLREEQSLLSCFRQFLDYHDRALLGHFFWHWAESPDPYRHFPEYLQRYGQELEEVVQCYIERLRQGRLLSIVHLNELIVYLMTGAARGHSACAVELAENYDIVGGQVTACADLPLSLGVVPGEAIGGGGEESVLGRLVVYRAALGCDQCGVYPYCGGRCPVQVLTGSPERTLQICQLMRLHVGTVLERMSDIADALGSAGIDAATLYRASARLSRFTDVVP